MTVKQLRKNYEEIPQPTGKFRNRFAEMQAETQAKALAEDALFFADPPGTYGRRQSDPETFSIWMARYITSSGLTKANEALVRQIATPIINKYRYIYAYETDSRHGYYKGIIDTLDALDLEESAKETIRKIIWKRFMD